MAQFERDLIREPIRAEMKAAKRRGKHVGKPHALSDGQVIHMTKLISQGVAQREVAE